MIKFKKIILIISSIFFLNGCFETATLVGPAITAASTGSAYQAGLTYGTSHIIERETGLSTIEYISNIMEPAEKKRERKIQEELLAEKKRERKIQQELLTLVENRIKSTRLKLYSNSN